MCINPAQRPDQPSRLTSLAPALRGRLVGLGGVAGVVVALRWRRLAVAVGLTGGRGGERERGGNDGSVWNRSAPYLWWGMAVGLLGVALRWGVPVGLLGIALGRRGVALGWRGSVALGWWGLGIAVRSLARSLARWSVVA